MLLKKIRVVVEAIVVLIAVKIVALVRYVPNPDEDVSVPPPTEVATNTTLNVVSDDTTLN